MSELNLMDTYEIREILGAGGGGTVFKAYHKNLQKDIVIKKIHADIQDENERRIETDILKNLHHQYLPQVFDYFVLDGAAYTVMDYIEGESFGKKLVRGERFSEKKVLKYAKQLCEALDYLHSQKLPVIHGDIKPDNIMLTPEDNICLIDFNISGISSEGHAVTFGYSEGYSAPEQYREFQRLSALVVSGRTDNVLGDGAGRTEKLEVASSGAGRTEKLEAASNVVVHTEKLGGASDGTGKTEKLIYMLDGARQTEKLDYGAGAEFKNETPEIPRKRLLSELSEGIPIDKRSDIYNLGATLYHIHSGKMLSRDTMNEIGGRTSEGFLFILNKALQKNPDNRYQSAGQMLAAVNKLYKHDSRYRNMKIRHSITYITLACVLLSGIYFVLHGRNVYSEELLAEYDDYIERLEKAREEQRETDVERIFEETSSFMPDRLEAYYQKALFLLDVGRYQEAVGFVRETLDGNSVFYTRDNVSDMYYIMGTACFEMGEYESASDAFANAIKYNGENSVYYVDRAIAFARSGDVEQAKKVLETAKLKDALNGNIYLVDGEIKLAEGDFRNAEEDFRRSIEEAGDDYTRMRAYVMCSKAILGQKGTVGSVEAGIELLEEAVSTLPDEYHAMLLEQLANMYIEGYELTEDIRYAEGVLDTLEEIEDAGWATFTTYDNMVNIYYQIGDYETEGSLLDELAQKYPDNYKVPMKQAFLEAAMQAEKKQMDRDYSSFVAYYKIAQEMYSTVKRDGWSDAEMQVLENAYQELIDGNWIE